MANLTDRIPIAPMSPADLERAWSLKIAADALSNQATQTWLSAKALMDKAEAHRSEAAYVVTRGEGLLWEELRLIARWIREDGGEANCRDEDEVVIAKTLVDKGVLTESDGWANSFVAAHALDDMRAIVDARPELLDP